MNNEIISAAKNCFDTQLHTREYKKILLAKKFPSISVHGLDIASNSIEQNNKIKI